MSELKPCPFCGGSALLRGFAVDEAMHWWVACENCGATSGELLAESTPDRDFAAESWNRRTPQPVTPAGGEVPFPRVETGVVQFGDDWPGIFIRGDNACATAMYLRGDISDPWRDAIIKSHADLLESCNVANKPDVRHIATHPPVAVRANGHSGGMVGVAWDRAVFRAGSVTSADTEEKYLELIYAVASKYPNETRHQTALRYIRQREAECAIAAKDAALNQRGGGG